MHPDAFKFLSKVHQTLRNSIHSKYTFASMCGNTVIVYIDLDLDDYNSKIDNIKSIVPIHPDIRIEYRRLLYSERRMYKST